MRPLLLVVEDDAATRTLLTVVLTRAGFEVDAVESATEALTLLTVVPYAAVTLDLYLHGTSGFDVLAALANRPDMLRRIVVVSAAPAAEVEELRRRYGVEVERKPFDLNDLLAKIQRIGAPAGPRSTATQFCRNSVTLGAKAGIVLKAIPDGTVFDATMSFGYPDGAVHSIVPIATDAPYPICKAYRSGAPIWLPSTGNNSEHPVLSEIWRAADAQAIVALPLTADGHTVGAVGWAFRESRRFTDTDRKRFSALAAHVFDPVEG